MNFRTDLALEKRENLSSCEVDGVISKREERKGVVVTTITVTNENGAKALGKPVGKYITLEVTPFMKTPTFPTGGLKCWPKSF